MRLIIARARLLATAALLLSCGGRSSDTLADTTPCVPGRATACDCANGKPGVQLCASDGQGLLACDCSGALGASGGAGGTQTQGSGGTGATGGSAGAGGTGAVSSAGGSVGSAGSAGSAGFSFVVADAEYSSALDSLVVLTTSPDEVHVVDPVGGSDVVISLPLPGQAVSVAPDGQTAAVGHDGWVTEVDLVRGTVLQTVSESAPTVDIVLAPNHYAYVFPLRDQWTTIRSVNLTTGKEEPALEGMFVRAGTLGKLQPGRLAMYGAQNGLSPSDIEKYDIRGGAVQYAYDSPYHGDYYMCGDLWFSEDGARIFTRCGNVFNASDDKATDMTYAGSLGINPTGAFNGGAAFVVHSLAAHQVLALVGDTVSGYGEGVRSADQIMAFDDTFLNLESTTAVGTLSGAPASCSHLFVHTSGGEAFALCNGKAGGASWIVTLTL